MTRRLTTLIALALLTGLIGASACDKSQPDDTAKASEAEEQPTEEKEATKSAEPEEAAEEKAAEAPDWKRVDPADLPDAKREKLERAKAAQGEFGKTLVETLTTAIGEGGFGNAVDVCKTDAPAIAEKVSTSKDLQIGRTSFKLRNPKNTPPEWAEPYVEDRVTEKVVLDGPDDTLGYMAPIKMGELCVNCHGTKDKLAPEVTETLAAKYPQDEATGFEEGDLRGWFWVRVD
ncbi:MAG: Tll0287-like domain-containing protein [Myxococcota bacterium]